MRQFLHPRPTRLEPKNARELHSGGAIAISKTSFGVRFSGTASIAMHRRLEKQALVWLHISVAVSWTLA
jgi:hypothetical protein